MYNVSNIGILSQPLLRWFFFEFIDSVKHLKIPVGSTHACSKFTPGPAGLGQTKDKPMCFLQVLLGVLQNKRLKISNLRRG